MSDRLKSVLVTVLIQGALAYVLIVGLAISISQRPDEALRTVTVTPQRTPPPPPLPERTPVAKTPPLGSGPSLRGKAVELHDWAAAGAEQRNLDFLKVQKWRDDNRSPEEQRLLDLRKTLPQGSGPGKVVRLRPETLPTHTLYWPPRWTRGKLPLVVWAGDHGGKCVNSSLAYAAFLSEIASHGYFVVALGNDDIDYPQPEGLAVLADGRPLYVQASGLTKAVDWALGENRRAGSPYTGKLDTDRIAYMGHGCGAGHALTASADPRTTTTVLLNSSAAFRPDPSRPHKPPLAQLEGRDDDRWVIEAGDENLAKARAALWPMFRAALNGVGHAGAYARPDRRWSSAVLAWLDWQLKGDSAAKRSLDGLAGDDWSRVEAIALSGPAG
jgi:hypothetical protein